MLLSLYDNLTAVDWSSVVKHRGLAAFWPVARETVDRTYQEWRRERDLNAIANALHELSDRQLKLIGMKRATIDRDVSALASWYQAHARRTSALRPLLTGGDPTPTRRHDRPWIDTVSGARGHTGDRDVGSFSQG